jgi:GNAT superfamily N-acetyltransferase
MIIRPARREDVPEIVAIYSMDPLKGNRECLRDPLPSSYFDGFDLIKNDPNQVLLVADQDSKVIGTLQITFVQHLICQGSRRAVIEAMFVHPSHQGAGVGAALIQAAVNIAVAANCIALELTSNKARDRAHKFYERAGFTSSHQGFKMALKQSG